MHDSLATDHFSISAWTLPLDSGIWLLPALTTLDYVVLTVIFSLNGNGCVLVFRQKNTLGRVRKNSKVTETYGWLIRANRADCTAVIQAIKKKNLLFGISLLTSLGPAMRRSFTIKQIQRSPMGSAWLRWKTFMLLHVKQWTVFPAVPQRPHPLPITKLGSSASSSFSSSSLQSSSSSSLLTRSWDWSDSKNRNHENW